MVFHIGELAEKCNVNKETIRYYERLGLILEPSRTESGYRIYTEQTVDRLNFIKISAEGCQLRLVNTKQMEGRTSQPVLMLQAFLSMHDAVAHKTLLTHYHRESESDEAH